MCHRESVMFAWQLDFSRPPLSRVLSGGASLPVDTADGYVKEQIQRQKFAETVSKASLTVWPFSLAQFPDSVFPIIHMKSFANENSWLENEQAQAVDAPSVFQSVS